MTNYQKTNKKYSFEGLNDLEWPKSIVCHGKAVSSTQKAVSDQPCEFRAILRSAILIPTNTFLTFSLLLHFVLLLFFYFSYIYIKKRRLHIKFKPIIEETKRT